MASIGPARPELRLTPTPQPTRSPTRHPISETASPTASRAPLKSQDSSRSPWPCVLPTGSIFILHWIVDPAVWLGIIFAMPVIFAVCMELMTPAKTHEFFAASSM